MPGKPTLRRALATQFAVVAVIPLAVVSLLVLRHLTVDTRAEISRKNLQLARAVGGQVQAFLREPLQVLRHSREEILATRAPEVVEGGLDRSVRSSPLFESLFLLDTRGHVAGVGLPRDRVSFREEYRGLDLSAKRFYLQTRQTQKATWSDAYLSLVTGRMSLTLCLPVDDRVLVGNFKIDLLSDFVAKIRLGQPMEVIVVDRHGDIIVHPDPSRVGRQESLRHLAPVRAGLEGWEGTQTCGEGPQACLASVAHIEGPDWLIVVTQLTRDAYASLWTTGWLFAAATLGSLGLALLLAFRKARRYARPLETLAERAGRVAGGDYGVDLPAPDLAEVADLTESFRKMVGAVGEREAWIEESRRRYERLFQNIRDAVFVHRVESDGSPGPFVEVNDVACKMLGHTRGELLAMEPEELMVHGHRDLVPGVSDDLRRTGQFLREFDLIHADGSTVPVEVHAHRVQLGEAQGILSVARDIRERRRAEEERLALEKRLRHSQKLEAVGTLAGGIAHDFNNILHAVSGYAELLLGSLPEDGADHRRASQIFRGAERAADLVRRLLTFSRRDETCRQTVDLNREVSETVELLERTIPKMIELRTDLDPGLPPVAADPTLVEQALMNLVANARDAMPQGGELTVETRSVWVEDPGALGEREAPPGPYVVLRVADTGEGMDPETVEHIFEPFFTTKEVGKGTGLGLSTVYGAARAHGGWVRCKSVLGSGAEFEIYLPALGVGSGGAPEAPPAPAPAVGTGGTILLVDDEATVRELGEQGLKESGYRVGVAASGEEALESLEGCGGAVDLVVLDLGMPGMGGRRCLEALRRRWPDLKVVIASGYGDAHTGEIAKAGGAVGVLPKPYRLADLVARVHDALEVSDSPGDRPRVDRVTRVRGS